MFLLYHNESLMYEFTCGGPGFDVSCTMDDYILGFSFLGWTQAIPDVKGKYYQAKFQIFTLQHWTFEKINKSMKTKHLFLFLRKLSLFMDNGSTGQEPHLQKHRG